MDFEFDGALDARLITRAKAKGKAPGDGNRPDDVEFSPSKGGRNGVVMERGPNGEELVDDTFAGVDDDFTDNLESQTRQLERYTGPRQSHDI